MIKFLRVRNLATIEDLTLSFESGFSILTGETGAGKSIIIDAIRLILGEKASPDLVRTGRAEALVEAVFDVSGERLDLDGLPEPEDGELLVQRSVTVQGAGKASVNGVLVPVRRLREIGGRLIDIYGQNDHVFLLHLENHLAYLDAALDDPALVRDTARAAQDLRRLLQEKRDLEAREKEREQRLDFIAYQAGEIEAAGLKPGEDESLLRERDILRDAGKIAGLVDRALDVAYLGEDSLVPRLARLRSLLGELGAYDASFGDFRAGLEEAAILLQDAADALVRFKDRRAGAPEDPEAVEERLSVIEKLKRKHGGTIEAVLARGEELRRERAALEGGRERLQELGSAIAARFADYAALAARLGAARRRAAGALGRAIEKEIALLGMAKARFEVRLSPVPPSVDDAATVRDQGAEDAEFLLSPNPGEELRPLRRIASGGELSRMMLALKSAGRDREDRKTLIFDEIDAGIGGRTAEFIARKLGQLAARHQVICITHLPQIAAAAAQHFHVDKRVEKDRTFTAARRLGPEERVEEIARLVAGSRLTEASRQTAREMLEGTPGKGQRP
ncbi:MAG: DNA repair protein RecN [Acidobacteria bacterium]|jgi:DNA repair protein RecN (Recombination protein N)|nr:DNA repair protein RecN [Acidobacteriota bacterium]